MYIVETISLKNGRLSIIASMGEAIEEKQGNAESTETEVQVDKPAFIVEFNRSGENAMIVYKSTLANADPLIKEMFGKPTKKSTKLDKSVKERVLTLVDSTKINGETTYNKMINIVDSRIDLVVYTVKPAVSDEV